MVQNMSLRMTKHRNETRYHLAPVIIGFAYSDI